MQTTNFSYLIVLGYAADRSTYQKSLEQIDLRAHYFSYTASQSTEKVTSFTIERYAGRGIQVDETSN